MIQILIAKIKYIHTMKIKAVKHKMKYDLNLITQI